MKRTLIKQLIAWKLQDRRKPLILRGARQVGKTYLLQEFGKNYFRKVHYFNFEKEANLCRIFDFDFNPKRILNELSMARRETIKIEEDLVIFDEIQNCPKAVTSLKYFNEDIPTLALACAGSLLGVHLGESSFPVGKVDMLMMYPMSFEEFLLALGDESYVEILKSILEVPLPHLEMKHLPETVHDYLWNQLKIYFVIGGLPEVVYTYIQKKENPSLALEATRVKQEELIIAYNADMAKHAGKVNAMHIDRIWRSIPAQLAQSQDGSAHKFKFKGVISGISRFDRLSSGIDWLEAAGLIIKIPITKSGKLPFSAYAKENSFKLLCFDVGILGALSGLSPKTILDYGYGSYKGYFAENYVSQEFLYSEKKLFSWEEGSAEIEFLIEKEGSVIPIEVKSGSVTKAKSLHSFREKYHPPYQVILSAKNLHYDLARFTYYYPLYLANKL